MHVSSNSCLSTFCFRRCVLSALVSAKFYLMLCILSLAALCNIEGKESYVLLILCMGLLCIEKGSESPRSTCQVISDAGNRLRYYNGAC